MFTQRTVAWTALDTDGLTAADFAIAERLSVEILLVGTGIVAKRLPEPIRTTLRASGIALDAMGTGTACRTYNLLAAEARRVAAALIALS